MPPPLPRDVIQEILLYTSDLRLVYALREAAGIPDGYWAKPLARARGDAFVQTLLRASPTRRRPLAWHFEQTVLPNICNECGRISWQCMEHAILGHRLCYPCLQLPEYRLITSAAACRRYSMRKRDLPRGAFVRTALYEYTLHLECEVRARAPCWRR